MGECKEPEYVKLIVGMISREEPLFTLAERMMESLWGEIDIRSEVMAFDQTNYYEKEMGSGLLRKFVGFEILIDPGQLAGIKHQTNTMEVSIGEGADSSVDRPINLDPGYVEMSKLVLATTKNYAHRIYIGEKMYAEATLHYHKGAWQGWPYTYPDYASGVYDPFFNAVRAKLAEQSKI